MLPRKDYMYVPGYKMTYVYNVAQAGTLKGIIAADGLVTMAEQVLVAVTKHFRGKKTRSLLASQLVA